MDKFPRGNGWVERFFARLWFLIPAHGNTPRAYLLAAVLMAIALLIRLLLAPVDGGVQYVTFFPAVALVAVVGGLGHGLFAALIGVALASYFFWPPYASIALDFHHEMFFSNAVFLIDALLVCTAIEAMHRFYRRFVEAERELRLAASVFEDSAEGVIVTDGAGTIQLVNPAFTEITGYSSGEALGRKPSILQSGRQGEDFYRSMWDALIHSGRWEGELWNRRKNGEIYPQRLIVSRILDDEGAPLRYVGVFHDITKEKQAEQTLRDADRRKNEFIAMLAHELRNPLAPIRNAAHILSAQDAADPLGRQARELIDRQVSHMVRLIDDLLDVSRISRGKLQLKLERVELAAVLEQALEAARPSIDAARHELTLTMPSEPIGLDADPVRLAQVFLNLFNNASKFSGEGGRIEVDVGLEKGQAAVRVRDNGIGIAREHLPHVFEMFEQVGSSADQGGLGIGLALARGLIEMHGGRIEARSEGAGKGSEFVVRLPVTSEPAQSAAPEQLHDEEPRQEARLKVLVVDDNRDNAESLALMLSLHGNEVQTAYDGLEAVEAAARFRPDAIFLDIGLPKLDGYGACRRIREQHGQRNVLIFALTGWGQEDDRRKSQEAGFDAHLVKPVDPSALLRLLAGSPPRRT